MRETLKEYLQQELSEKKQHSSLLGAFNGQSQYDLIDQLTDIILEELDPISTLAAIHMLDILSQVEEQSKKLAYEKVYIKLITHYKENEGENFQIQAKIIAALLRRFSTFLSISDYDLFSLILAQKRSKMIRGLFLLKEITSSKQWFQSYDFGLYENRQVISSANQISNPLKMFYKAGKAVIFGVNEVINTLINKWEKKQDIKLSKKASKDKAQKEEIDANLLITVSLIQLQNEMAANQKKKVFPLIVTQLNASKYLEEDRDLLFNYLNLLKICDSNFFLKREVQVFKKLTILISMYEIEELKEFNVNTNEETLRQLKQEEKFIEMNKHQAALLGLYVFEETVQRPLGKQCKFIPEMIDFMLCLCQLDAITIEDEFSQEESSPPNKDNNNNNRNNITLKSNSPELNQVFTDYQYLLETINQSSKKIIMNDVMFNKIITQVKKIGSGSENISNKNIIDYSLEDIRVLIGFYNMLFYQTKFNVDPIRSTLGSLTKYIGSHLKNPSIQCYAIRFLFQVATQAINYITPFHSTYLQIIIDIAQMNTNSSTRESIMSISFIERVISKIVYEEDFTLFDYIPKVYEVCLNKYSSSEFGSQSLLYQELIQNLITSILHKKKIEYYIKDHIQRSKEIFFSYVERNEDNKMQIESEDKQPNGYQQQQQQSSTSSSSSKPHPTSHLSCLSSLAKMVIKSQHCKDDDLVNRVKILLRQYANELYQGKFDDLLLSRTEIYQFMYSISLEFLNDQQLIEELFLKMYKHILADCQVNTNVKLIKRNQNDQDEEEEDHHFGQQNLNINLGQFHVQPPNNNIQNNQQQQQQQQQHLPQQGLQNQQAIAQFFQNNNIQNIMQNLPQNLQNNLQNLIQNVQQVQPQPIQNQMANPQNDNNNNNGQDDANSEDFESESEAEGNIQILNQGIEDGFNHQLAFNQQQLQQYQQQADQNEDQDEDDVEEQEDLDDDFYEQVYYEQPSSQLVGLKSNALFLLGEFIQECPQIVMEYKKFEIMKVLKATSQNDKEETTITFMNYQTLGQMFKCIQQYFKNFYPHLYLQESTETTEEAKNFLSQEARVEYNPLINIFLSQIQNLDKLNEDNIHEELLYKLSYVLRNIDIPTKRTYFNEIFQTIKENVGKTMRLYQSGLIDKQMECLQIIYKAYPSKLKENFIQVWRIIDKYFFKSKESQDSNEDEEEEEKENNEEEIDEEEEEEENGDDDNMEEFEDENQDPHSQNKKEKNLEQDLSIISSTIGYASHFIKYDKCAYPIVSKTINKIILNKTLIEDEILLRNCIYYVNVVTRYCYDVIEPSEYKQMYDMIGQIVSSKKLDEYDEKGTLENIYAAYALMASKQMGNINEKTNKQLDLAPFHTLFSIVPFEDDYPEMKRVIIISEYLFNQNLPIVEQNLSKIVLSTIQMINEPLRYRIKQKTEHIYHSFYHKLVQRFPQTVSIAQNFININKNNTFKEKDIILSKLNIS